MNLLIHDGIKLYRRSFIPGPDSLGETRDDFDPPMFGVTADGQIVNGALNPGNGTIFRFCTNTAMKSSYYYYDGGDCYYAAIGNKSLTIKEKTKIDNLISKAVSSSNYHVM